MIIAAVVLFVASVVLFVISASQGRKLAAMRGTQTSGAADLQQLAASVGKEIGSGAFAEPAEVKGTVRCGQPLVSELAEVSCVYYSMKVTREYEETRWEKDSSGNSVQRTQRGSDTVAENTRSVGFEVEDATGRIGVEPHGASFVAERVLSRFDQGEAQAGGMRVGRWVMSLGGLGGGRRTIGYRYEEHAIPVDREIYVLGEASDEGGKLRMRKPGAKGTGGSRFIISLKSEEELSRSAARTATVLRVIAIAAAAVGAGLLVAGVMTGR
jgi:hypothetical protein